MSSVEACQQPQPDQHVIVGADKKNKCYLLLSNPSKTTHLGTILRCAAAFQVHQVLLVGYDKFNWQGSFGSHLFLDIVVFPSWESVHDYLRRGGDDGEDDEANAKSNVKNGGHVGQNEHLRLSTTETPTNDESKSDQMRVLPLSSTKNPIAIIGILGAYAGGEDIFSRDGTTVYKDLDKKYVSLVPRKDTAHPGNTHHNQDSASCSPHRSFPISSRPFSTDVCFLLSKDKWGIPLPQAQMCTGFVHVPHLTFDDDAPSLQMPESNDSISSETTTPRESSPKPTKISLISQPNLLDTATTLSVVLHHFTAWAHYTERLFAENQKFVKDIKSNRRRRLCRVAGQHTEERDQSIGSKKPESNTEQEAMDAMILWKENADELPGSDY